MKARDPELRNELDAALQARSELGSEYEPALVESFLEKVEQRLDSTLDRRVRRHLAEQRVSVARDPHPPHPLGNFGERYGFGIISLVLAVPLSAIGASTAHTAGLIVAWLGIVAVNAVHAARPRFLRRPARTDSDWEE
ncbi:MULTISPECIES: hypothetical protein [unclassified Streptomyces]|uniref:hypothetical protein n=1 Tax=unclassified Streptomyces TaxID=2593676 RepID=UPI002E78FB8A|nr:hypothetical protein [Streptomyces sp. JV184]MEE1743677.1 hypothetical protein [Streptomyces sp. JV184]